MFLAWSDMRDPKNNLLPMALCFLFLFLFFFFFFFTPLSQASGSSNLLLIHFLLCVCVCEGIFFTWSSQVKRKKKTCIKGILQKASIGGQLQGSEKQLM